MEAKTQALPGTAKVKVVPRQPCLKAVLLALHGKATQGKTTQQLKHAFAPCFGVQAHDTAVYAKHFFKALLDDARRLLPEPGQLLALIKAA